MRFEYTLNGVGWSKLSMEIDGQEYQSSPSYLTDPLKDIMEGLLTLLFQENERRQCSFVIEMEPQIDHFKMKVENDQLKITIERLQDYYYGNPEPIFNVLCNLDEFIKLVTSQIDILVKTYGIIGYKNTWNGNDFPLSSFLKLKYYLHNNKEMKVTESPNFIFKSNLSDELNLLTL